MITDAQVHIFEADRPDQPWPPLVPGRPAAPRPSFSAEEMIAEMDAIGVDRAVIVPPTWAGDHNRTAFAAVERYPSRFAIMGRLDPFAPGAEAALETWLEQPGMLGIRLSSVWMTSPKTFIEALEDGSLAWFWAACERLDIPLMCLTRASVGHLGPVAAKHPRLTLIVDHLATVQAESVPEAFVALDDLLAVSKYPNVHVKVSTAPNYSREPFPYRDVHDILRRVYDSFGPRRMLWAADLTQLTRHSYADCLRLWQEGIPWLSDEDREWILGRTAAEVLRWPEP